MMRSSVCTLRQAIALLLLAIAQTTGIKKEGDLSGHSVWFQGKRTQAAQSGTGSDQEWHGMDGGNGQKNQVDRSVDENLRIALCIVVRRLDQETLAWRG